MSTFTKINKMTVDKLTVTNIETQLLNEYSVNNPDREKGKLCIVPLGCFAKRKRLVLPDDYPL
jgi:hypothetical protein